MRHKILILAGLFMAMALPQVAQANQLNNGDFESPVVVEHFNIPAGDSTSITDWTVTQGNVDLTTTGCCFHAQSGNQAVDLIGMSAGNGGLTQTFGTTAGQKYEVTLFHSRNYGASAFPGGPTITSASATVSLTGTAILPLLFSTITDAVPWPGLTTPCTTDQASCVVWTEYTGTFTADSSSTTITIDNLTGGYNGGIYLDNVDVEAIRTSTTPLPGALPLLLSGIGGFVMLARRRRKALAA